jgi:hypothetical protein
MVEFRANPGKRSFVDHLLAMGDVVIEMDVSRRAVQAVIGSPGESSFITRTPRAWLANECSCPAARRSGSHYHKLLLGMIFIA